MVVDHIRNRELYYGLGEGFRKALEYCAEYKPGRTERADEEIDGKDVFARIRPMIPKPVEQCKIDTILNRSSNNSHDNETQWFA